LWKATQRIKAQNTVVFSGLELKEETPKNNSGQIDFIIISLPLKSIIQIEAKTGNNTSNRKSASAQLKRGQTFFEEKFPFPNSANWKYVKAMCFGQSVENNICDQCKPFILSSNFITEETTQSVSEKIADQFQSFLSIISSDENNGKYKTYSFTSYKFPIKGLIINNICNTFENLLSYPDRVDP
jgi:hypothetical protein